MTVIQVERFAQIQDARVTFGDLTVLVGPQASGKSLILQWLKAALDAAEIVPALREAGHDVGTTENVLDLIFGEGMSSAWGSRTRVRLDGRDVKPQAWTKHKTSRPGKVFFVPAHRALLLAEGWPAPFLKLNADTPVVARLFSQHLYQRFSGRQAASLFPVDRILKKQYRDQIDRAVFHGASVELEKEGLRYRLRLSYDGDVNLPFMTWTAGQREFTPLLLGLYHVLPPRAATKLDEVDWVVIEEPEMGLHPQAITALMLLVLDLLWRGYRVVISTHSPLVLDVVWAIRRIAEHGAQARFLADAFDVTNSGPMRKVLDHALRADHRVYFLDVGPTDYRVTSRDISALDPDSDEPAVADWGGLTGFSSRFGDAVRDAVNDYAYGGA